MRVTNGIPLGCLLPLTIVTENCVQTLKGGTCVDWLQQALTMNSDTTLMASKH
jgi:hypothetical protein